MSVEKVMNEAKVNSKCYKRKLTAIVCFAHFGFGLGSTILGQALADIKLVLEVDSLQIAYAFVIRSALYCVGAILCGCLYSHFNRQLLYSLQLLIFGCCAIVSPHIPSLPFFLFNEAILGFCTGGVDTASSVLVLEMWEKESNPYLQAIHTCFAVGVAVGPLITAPFLAKEGEYPHLIPIPFAIAGLVLITGSAIIFYFESFFPYQTPHRSMERKNEVPEVVTTNVKEDNSPKVTEKRQLLKAYNVVCVILGSLTLCFFTGTEFNIYNYLPTFVLDMDLGISKQTASMMSAAYGTMYAGFRAISIVAATKINIATMIYISLFALLIGYSILLILGAKSVAFIWIAVALIGAGCSSIYGSMYAFIEQRIDITNWIGSFFMFSCSFTAIVWPIILGNSIESDAMIFVYVNGGCILLTLTTFILLHSTNLWKKCILNK